MSKEGTAQPVECLQKRSLDAVNGMLRLLNNPAKSIPHVHIHGALEAGTSELFERALRSFGQSQTLYDRIVILRVNCLVVEGDLKTLLNEMKKQIKEQKFVCENMEDFSELADQLRKLGEDITVMRIYLIFNDAEALQKFTSTQLVALFSLPLKFDVFIRIFTISELPWSEIGNTSEFVSAPINLRVFPPTREEIVTMIALQMKNVPERFIRLIVGTLHFQCTDVNILYRKTFEAWKTYLGLYPTATESKGLHLPSAIEALKEVQSISALQILNEKPATKSTLPLSISSRYLILAAFFASQNNPSTDKRFFAKFHGRERRNEGRERQAALLRATKDLQVKQFDITRLYMIYRSLLESYPPDNRSIFKNIDVHSQINSLVSMGLLQRTSATANLDVLKFKCLLDAETAKAIAATINDGIEINRHLEVQPGY